MRRAFKASLATILFFGVDACGDKSSTPPEQSIAVAINGTTLGLTPGKTSTIAVAVTRVNGYAGFVNLSADGAPAGIVGTFSPNSLAPNVTASTLNVSASTSVAAGTYSITVHATGAGVTEKTLPLSLTVTASGAFTVSVAPSTVSVAQGAAGSVVASLARTSGYAGPVTFSVTGAPTGMTVSAIPAIASGDLGTITVSASSSVATGSYPLTLRANAPGVTEQTAAFTVTVGAAGTTSTIAVPFCAANAPLWVGAQNESGPWTQLTAVSPNVYRMTIGARGGLAVVSGSSPTSLDVVYASPAEMIVAAGGGCEAAGSKSLRGSVAGITGQAFGNIVLGRGTADIGAGDTSYTLTGVNDGSRDHIGVRLPVASNAAQTNKIIIRRGLNPSANDNLQLMDFNSAEGFSPATATLGLSNVGTDSVYFTEIDFMTASTSAATPTSIDLNQTVTRPMTGVPSDKMQSGDVHQLQGVTLLRQTGAGFEGARVVYQFFTTIENKVGTFGPAPAPLTLTTAASSPYYRPRIQMASQAAYGSFVAAFFDQLPTRRTTLIMTANYLGGVPANWDVTFPDLSQAGGFTNTWGLLAGSTMTYEIDAYGGSSLTGILGPPVAGNQYVIGVHSSPTGGVATFIMDYPGSALSKRLRVGALIAKKTRQYFSK